MASNHQSSPADHSFEMQGYSREQQGLSDPTGSPQRGPLYRDPVDGQDSERDSLLRSSGESSSSYSGNGGDIRRILPGTPSVFAITIAASALILTLDVVASVPTAPRMVIFEDIICRNHYALSRDGDGEAMDCKIEPVQSELAQINGWKETFDTIPGTCTNPWHLPQRFPSLFIIFPGWEREI